jgi:RNA polymerase sigma-70 factor, ECF subfamily
MAGPVVLADGEVVSQVRRGFPWVGPRYRMTSSLPDPENAAYADAREGVYASPESLFMDHYEPLARAITLAVHDPEVARDAVQEAFARLCREWDTVSGYRHQVAWVRKVALNLARDHQRRSRRSARLFLSLDEMDLDPPESAQARFSRDDPPLGGDPELWRAVRQLPEKQRAAVGLFYIADLSVEQVAEAMGVSQGTVKRHLDRARNTLRTKIEA